MQSPVKIIGFAAMLAFSSAALCDATVPINAVDETGVGKSLGTVVISETRYGLVFTPALSGLPSGVHGFHVHENPSCQPGRKDGKMQPAMGAGEHYDPEGSKHHGLPWSDGHKGDLPALVVDASGHASDPVLAPRLKLADVRQRSLMVHVGGDNHADQPQPAGGGGVRMACGVIE